MFKHYSTYRLSSYPSRLVWGDPPESPRARIESKTKPREGKDVAVERSRKTEILKKQVEADKKLTEKLEAQKDRIKDFIQTRPGHMSEDLTVWNADFLAAVYETDPRFILQVQEMVFRRLGLKGDNLAKVDGVIGPYSVRALALYLNLDFPEYFYEDPDQGATSAIPYVKEAQINQNLWRKMSGGQVERAQKKDEENIKPLLERLEKQPDYFYSEFEVALVNAPDQSLVSTSRELFDENIKDVIFKNKGKIDTKTADGWRRAFRNAGLEDYQIEAMGLVAEDPIRPVETVESGSQESTPSASESVRIKLDLASAQQAVSGSVNQFKETASALDQAHKTEKTRADEVLKTVEAPPSHYKDIVFAPFQKKFEAYEKAYNDWDVAFNQAEVKVGFEDELLAKQEAFKAFKEAVNNYYKELLEVTDLKSNPIDNSYAKELAEYASKYDFPADMPSDIFVEPDPSFGALSRFSKFISTENTYNLHLFSSGKFFNSGDEKGYLKPQSEIPKKAIKTKAEFLGLMVGSDIEKAESFKVIKEKVGVSTDEDLIKAYNNWIYYNNILRFNKEKKDLMLSKQKERKDKIDAIKAKVF